MLKTEKKEAKDFIKNGSFEETVSDKYKKLGQLSLASGWTTANEEKADLFTSLSTYPEIGVPQNAMGICNPKDGNNYAGMLVHNVASKDGREYITSQLDGFLAKGKKYCLKYSISLG